MLPECKKGKDTYLFKEKQIKLYIHILYKTIFVIFGLKLMSLL